MKDLVHLKNYKQNIITQLRGTFGITQDEADYIVTELEKEGLLRIEAPVRPDVPIQYLTMDKPVPGSNLGMTSHNLGNVWINARMDWKNIAVTLLGSVPTVFGFASSNIILIVAGLLECIISASKLADIKISENGTAIILCLQKHKQHQSFRVTEERCKQDANEILGQYGYEEMDENTFQREISILLGYKCIEEVEGIITLQETVLFNF